MKTPGAPSASAAAKGGAPRRVRRSVYVWDRAATVVITLGGLGVIAAVLGILVYLVSVAAPLFAPGRMDDPARAVSTRETAGGGGGVSALSAAVLAPDASGRLVLELTRGGDLRVLRLDAPAPEGDGAGGGSAQAGGALVAARRIVPEGRALTAWSFEPGEGLLALGFDDGTVRLGRLAWSERLVAGAAPGGAGASGDVWGEVRTTLANGDVRLSSPVVEVGEALTPASGTGAVLALDYRRRAGGDLLAVLRAGGDAAFSVVRFTRPLGGGAARARTTERAVPLGVEGQSEGGNGAEGASAAARPVAIFASGDGDRVLTLGGDGEVRSYVVARGEGAAPDAPLVFSSRLMALGEGRRATAWTMLPGGLSLVIGDDAGWLTTVFAAPNALANTPDGTVLVSPRRVRATGPEGGRAVGALGLSTRDRNVVVGDDAGGVFVVNMLSGKAVAGRAAGVGGAVEAAAATGAGDAVVAAGADGSVASWPLRAGHPEVSFASLFLPVWYEGFAAPAHVYQSGRHAGGQPKYGLTTLIFGTLKATVFALLFAAPIAVLGALYTSEFLHARARQVVKPTLEMMASLPSVVLGFVAAAIVAPLVRDWLAGVLLAFIVVPVAVLVAAHLWQAIPSMTLRRLGAGGRALAILATLGVAGAASVGVGRAYERAFFTPSRADVLAAGGSVAVLTSAEVEELGLASGLAWLGRRTELTPGERRELRAQGLYVRDGAVVRVVEPAAGDEAAVAARAAERGVGGASVRRWLDGNYGDATPGWVLLCVAPAAAVVGLARARMSARLGGANQRPTALAALGGLLGALGATGAVAWGMALGLTALGMDPRDSVFGPFNDRNSLVVGIIMGFAIIPIIFTISEDAMRSVPASLRSASLGAGATPWQTATRIVLPVAASGIFSACMIGLGRAVGETMIVVMATGNTATMDPSIFSGFRTLSANIAVEVGEASVGDTLFRLLFLCGLILFAMTFVINTTAEVVRQRFRKRNAAL